MLCFTLQTLGEEKDNSLYSLHVGMHDIEWLFNPPTHPPIFLIWWLQIAFIGIWCMFMGMADIADRPG